VFGPRETGGRAAQTRQIKAWVRTVLGGEDDVSVVVAELRCSEPGCPPLGTMVAVLGDRERIEVKIHAALADVTFEAVRDGLRRAHPTHVPPSEEIDVD
jgi:hypothetical protein